MVKTLTLHVFSSYLQQKVGRRSPQVGSLISPISPTHLQVGFRHIADIADIAISPSRWGIADIADIADIAFPHPPHSARELAYQHLNT